MDDRATGAWGELKTPEPELNYAEFLDPYYDVLTKPTKPVKAKNRRMWRRVENLLWKTAWTVGLVALGLAVVM